MRPGPRYLRLVFALLAVATGATCASVAPAQEWSSQPSHYSRGLSQSTTSSYDQPTTSPPAVRPPMPFRLVNAEEAIPLESLPNASAERHLPLKLAPREKPGSAALERPAKAAPLSALSGAAGSLAAVIGLFLIVVWCSRRLAPAGSTVLPKEVVELLGRAPLGARQQMHLVRLGNKLVLLSVTATGTEALAEVTEPNEVERLSALCRRQQPGSSSTTFSQLISQIGSEPAAASFVGDTRRAEPTTTARRR